MPLPEHFELPRPMRWLYVLAPLMTAGLTIFLVTLPFTAASTPESCSDNRTALAWLATIGGALCAGITLAQIGPLRRLPRMAISADADGLWATCDGKAAGLVAWHEIARPRERPLLKRLELLDAAGRVRLRLEFLLTGFQRLRTLVLERASLEPVAGPADGRDLHQPWSAIAFDLVTVLGLVALCGYAYEHKPLFAMAGAALFLGVGTWNFITQPLRLRLEPDHLEIHWPFKRAWVARTDIRNIAVEDDSQQPSRAARVALYPPEPSPPIYLHGFGLQLTSLCLLLRAWKGRAP